MITDLRSFLKVSCHTKFRFAECKAQCILGGPLKWKTRCCNTTEQENELGDMFLINYYLLEIELSWKAHHKKNSVVCK